MEFRQENRMRFNHRSPGHWIAVVLVLVLGLFTFKQAGGHGPAAALPGVVLVR